MKLKSLAVILMLLVTTLVAGGMIVLGKDGKPQSMYGEAKEARPAAAPGPLKFAYHGVPPHRSAFAINGDKGTGLYLTSAGYYTQRDLTKLGALNLYTPFGPAPFPGIQYKNEGADPTNPTMPQTFWISDSAINGPYYVIAWSDSAGGWQGLTEECVGRPLQP